jgi:hypothetical protein
MFGAIDNQDVGGDLARQKLQTELLFYRRRDGVAR